MTTQKKTTPEQPAAMVQDAHGAAIRDRLRNRKRPTATLTICDDPDVKQTLASARFLEQRAAAQAEDATDTAAAAKVLADARSAAGRAQEAFDQVAIVLRFQALEREAFEALKAEHPPTEEQAEDGAEWNTSTWCPALISAASLDGITVEDATEYMRTWATNEAVQLYETAFGVQTHSRMDLGKG